jgi:MOSC domain-containing protein YiiM
MKKLISVNICSKRAESGIYKLPVAGPIGTYDLPNGTYLFADLVQNKKVHGGPDRAICCYSYEYYSRWYDTESKYELGLVGENFTTVNMKDDLVYLGDMYKIGSMKVQITCNRGPCNTLANRLKRKDAPKEMLKALEMGYYMSIVEKGVVHAGDEIELIERMPDYLKISMRDYCYTKYFEKDNQDNLNKILSCKVLGADDKIGFLKHKN